MCRKCFLKGKRAKLSKGKINFFAHELLKGHGVPLFSYSPNNYAIEGRVWKIERERTKKNKYYNKPRRKINEELGIYRKEKINYENARND